ncbi:hypothetical protein SPI_00773 [Niveomyces insectorum RCEF 264]|uniref:Uncharacterized protein n=1 Tax=Niveomyces insectorum RCEF 264 TaxID=1081102 RepID=A0A168ACY1_9HYPO|nr:hypothetical protein SPI_00773 [Niveomyces insectorum RCEF 264]
MTTVNDEPYNGPSAGAMIVDHSLARERASQALHSLVAYIAVRHGTADPALTDDEIAALQTWFAGGEGRTVEEVNATGAA